MSTSCIKIGFLLGEKWGISCSWVFLGFFFRNCLSSGNELRRKLGSHNGCNMTHGKELRTEILISSMEICGKTTPVSSAACTEMWTLQFLLSGSRCWLGKWPFFQIKSNLWWWLYHGTENGTTEQTRGWARRGAWSYGQPTPEEEVALSCRRWLMCLLSPTHKDAPAARTLYLKWRNHLKKLYWNSLQSLWTVIIHSEKMCWFDWKPVIC